MRTLPPVTTRMVSQVEWSRRVEEWKQAHPGYDASNFVDAFRNGAGELDETDEFFAAVELFTAFDPDRTS